MNANTNTSTSINTATADNLYVSTSLDYFPEPDSSPLGKDIVRDGIVYRRLDIPYLAWLNAQFEKAMDAYNAGKITDDVFSQLHETFADIYEFAYARMGGDSLWPMIKKVNLKVYQPPKG